MVFPGSGPSGAYESPDDGFRPSHVVPAEGLPAWEAPDPGRPTVPLDPFLPVLLLERLGDWGRVLCANGWSAWVDGRLLVAVPPDPPAAGLPMGTATDPRPLLARAEEAVSRYRLAAEDLAAGRADGEVFRRRTQGLRIGLVVDGESLWMYDARRERWLYCDGARLSTYATSAGPSAAGTGPAVGEEPPPVAAPAAGATAVPGPHAPAGYEPTRVVDTDPAPDTGPEPTRVVDQTPAPDTGPEPTRVVDQTPAPDTGPEPTRVVDQTPDTGPEPTRVVEQVAPAGTAPDDDDADGPPDRTGEG
ncbi:hypothetical protein [Streptomyces lavendofoliae]|uniref:hypothetical protein n=1 Tax=Streptomyces lavendofoliae TaxID=67314 RepID=UPI003D902166